MINFVLRHQLLDHILYKSQSNIIFLYFTNPTVDAAKEDDSFFHAKDTTPTQIRYGLVENLTQYSIWKGLTICWEKHNAWIF